MFARVALFAHIQQTLFNVETIEPCRAAARCRNFRRGSFILNLPLTSVDHLLGAQDRSYRFRSNLHGK